MLSRALRTIDTGALGSSPAAVASAPISTPTPAADPVEESTVKSAIKSPAEVALMREAGQITAASFCDAIAATQELRTEGELAAMLEYGCKKRGAERQPIHPGARTLTQTVMGG